MPDIVLEAIDRVLAASDAATYLDAQDSAVAALGPEYERLCEVTRTHESNDVRWEGLQLVWLFEAPNQREILEEAMSEDPDPAVRECAKALLFRSVVKANVVASKKLSDDGLRTYVRDVREQTARRLYRAPD